jgi:PilZ domain
MDISHLYSTRINQTFDDDQAEIISILKRELLKHPKYEVRLINYYKGLPVSYPAQLISIERDTIELDVYPQQAVVMAEQHCTFVRCKAFKHDLFANVQYVNIRKRAASLRKFCYVEIMAERRNYVRLELDTHAKALIRTSDGNVDGLLTELAINGACVKVDQSFPLEIGDETILCLTLQDIMHQNADNTVNVEARLVGIEGDALPRYYRFKITPDKILDRVLAQYIFQRQIEIIHELKDATEIYISESPE